MNDTEKMLLALVVVAIILLIALYVRNRRHKEGMGSSCTEKCRETEGGDNARTRCEVDCWDAEEKAEVLLDKNPILMLPRSKPVCRWP
jgi:hypothetical protein